MGFNTQNPYSEKIIKYYDYDERIGEKIATSSEGFKKLNFLSLNERIQLISNIFDYLISNKESLSEIITLEMGKPIKQSRAEIEKCALLCKYYTENGQKFLEDILIQADAKKSYVSFQPLGIILSIMPWNFPFWQVFRFAIPAILAGNSVLLKHAPNTFGSAEAIEKSFINSDFPHGSFINLLVNTDLIPKIIADENVQGITFTGSTQTGKIVAGLASKYLKKTVLELGGSDPYIILEDADLEKTVDACVLARMINGGQSCIAGKRFIVMEKIKRDFEELFIQKIKSYVIGNPHEEITTLGPLARKDLQVKIHSQVTKSVGSGAKLLYGGFIPEERGFFYAPTILTEVQANMPAFNEETFGPVAAIISAKNTDDAITIANNTMFGLGAAIFSNDIEKAELIAKFKINAGTCFINDFVKSDPRMPFGGVKESGYGRELSSFGLTEFVNIKSIVIK